MKAFSHRQRTRRRAWATTLSLWHSAAPLWAHGSHIVDHSTGKSQDSFRQSDAYLLPLPLTANWLVLLSGEHTHEKIPASQLAASRQRHSVTVLHHSLRGSGPGSWFIGLGQGNRELGASQPRLWTGVAGHHLDLAPHRQLRVVYRPQLLAGKILHSADLTLEDVPPLGLGYTLGLSQNLLHWHSPQMSAYAGFYLSSTQSQEASGRWITGGRLNLEAAVATPLVPALGLWLGAGVGAALSEISAQDAPAARHRSREHRVLRLFISAHPPPRPEQPTP